MGYDCKKKTHRKTVGAVIQCVWFLGNAINIYQE